MKLGSILLLTILLTLLCSCGPVSRDPLPEDPVTGKALEPVTLKWYYYGYEHPDDQRVFAAVNTILKKRLNTQVDFQPIDPKYYQERMDGIFASGEEFDACFAADWVNSYTGNATKGRFLAVEDLLKAYCPTLLSTVPEAYWKAIRINGHLYGFLNYQIMCKQSGLWFKKSLIDRYHLEERIRSVKSVQDLEPIFDLIRKNEPAYQILIDAVPDLPMAGQSAKLYEQIECAFVDFSDARRKAVFIYDSPKTLNRIHTARDWFLKGYLVEKQAYVADFAKQQVFSGIVPTLKPGIEAELRQKLGFEVVTIETGAPYVDRFAATSTLHAISRTSKHPERVAMVMEAFYKDPELTNLMAYGIQDLHYLLGTDERLSVLPGSRYAGYPWMWGNSFQAHTLEGQSSDLVAVTQERNARAVASPLLGFVLDRKPIELELNLMGDIYKQWRLQMDFGLTDTGPMLAQIRSQHEKVGLKKVMAEIQRQVDAWSASQK